jgi:F0F1-type ATP synthase membrane subunit b/b'
MALSESGLPKQAQDNADMAEEFMATLGGATEEDTDKDKEAEASPDGSDKEGQEAEGSADETVIETADQGQQDDEDGEETTYKQRYESLQGKYNKEVPQLTKELRSLKEDIFTRMDDLTKQAPEPSDEEDADDTEEFEAELEGYREQFGDDLVEVIQKLAERKASKLVGDSLSPVSEKVDSVESAQIASAQTAFNDDLNEKIDGDWQALWSGEDQGFIDFLDSNEPNGLFTYREIASKANDTWDAEKLSKVFNTYLASIAKEEGKADEKVEQTAEEKAADKTTQERVAPTRKTVEAEPDSGEARIWTQADITEFRQKDRQGKYSVEESEALWADFLRAPSEGRIVD